MRWLAVAVAKAQPETLIERAAPWHRVGKELPERPQSGWQGAFNLPLAASKDMQMSACLSVCMYVCLSVCLSVCLFSCLTDSSNPSTYVCAACWRCNSQCLHSLPQVLCFRKLARKLQQPDQPLTPNPNAPATSSDSASHSRLIGQQCVKMHILMDLLN